MIATSLTVFASGHGRLTVIHLRQLVLDEFQRRNYSQWTTRCYHRAVEGLARPIFLGSTIDPLRLQLQPGTNAALLGAAPCVIRSSPQAF